MSTLMLHAVDDGDCWVIIVQVIGLATRMDQYHEGGNAGWAHQI
jgi:hypothetical protein